MEYCCPVKVVYVELHKKVGIYELSVPFTHMAGVKQYVALSGKQERRKHSDWWLSFCPPTLIRYCTALQALWRLMCVVCCNRTEIFFKVVSVMWTAMVHKFLSLSLSLLFTIPPRLRSYVFYSDLHSYMSFFVFFISLLIVPQHVSGNHVPIIRSWRLRDVIALCWYVPWLQEGGEVRLVGSAPMDALPTNRTSQPSCSHGTYQQKAITSRSRQLLMMGTWLPETCWATIRREIKNTKSDI